MAFDPFLSESLAKLPRRETKFVEEQGGGPFVLSNSQACETIKKEVGIYVLAFRLRILRRLLRRVSLVKPTFAPLPF